MLDHCGKHSIVSDVEVIPIQQVNEAYERTLRSMAEYQESAGKRGSEWIGALAKAQAAFTRELASVSPAAARALLLDLRDQDALAPQRRVDVRFAVRAHFAAHHLAAFVLALPDEGEFLGCALRRCRRCRRRHP